MAAQWSFRTNRDLRLLHKEAEPQINKTVFWEVLAEKFAELHPDHNRNLDSIRKRCAKAGLEAKINPIGLSKPRLWSPEAVEAFLKAYDEAEEQGSRTAFWYEVHRIYASLVDHPRPVRSLVTKAKKMELKAKLLSPERPCKNCGERVGRLTATPYCVTCLAKKRNGYI